MATESRRRKNGGPGGRAARGPRLARAVALVACALAAADTAGAARQQRGEDDEFRTRPFQLYDSPVARAIVEAAEEHVAGGRWSEALVELQTLLEQHRGDVLGAQRPRAEGARHPSQGDVHLGAASWAVTRLFELPSEARALYRDRYGSRATEALARALGAGDRRALADVARRWPLTDAGLRAWWALGDLEVERGEIEDGLRAWARAAVTLLGEPLRTVDGPDGWRALRESLVAADATEGAVARARFALETFAGEGGLAAPGAEPEAGFLSGIADETLLDPRGFGNEGWASEWRPPRSSAGNPFYTQRRLMRLFGARDAGAIYVNTSRAIHAIGAFSGQTLWSYGPSTLGWDAVPYDSSRRRGAPTVDDFGKAIDSRDQIVGVAVARGTVVAAVQLPLAYEQRDQFQRIKIIDVIPERRLVALDSATGAVRWDTFPPTDWDGDAGSFGERMTVVGPPMIVGGRVLAPVARQRGRIELVLGCFDLATGEVLWSTPIVTGQVPLNMFGRQVREFSAPPAVVAGATVLVQSNLGVIAAVDLFTGDTLWETIYQQVPIDPPTYYEVGELPARWRNAPPVVVDGTLIATPVDCPDLVAVDLATGALRWSVSHRALFPGSRPASLSRAAPETLVGADSERVYIASGDGLVTAFRSLTDLRTSAPARIAWQPPAPGRGLSADDMPMPAIDAEHVYLPGLDALTVLDRRTGRVVATIPGDLASGNLLVAGGALFAVSADNVTAAFEWAGMVTRAEAAVAAAPSDPRPVAELARLFLERGEAAALEGESAEAARMYGAATRVLRGGGADGPGAPRLLREPLYGVLRAEARLLRLGADPLGAEERLQRALAVAPDAVHARDALLALQAVQRGRAGGAWEATLDRLASEHGRERITVTFQPTLGWAPGGAGGRAPEPWSGQLVPTTARASGDDAPAPGRRADLSIGLWVALERIAEAYRAEDAAQEARRLFALLEAHGDEVLPGGGGADVRLWAAGRLGLLRQRADASVFAPFEAEAAARLDAARREGRADALALVAARFPGTEAARTANALRLDLAVDDGDVAAVARIVLGALPGDATLAAQSAPEAGLLLRLAAAVGTSGNVELRAALGERLAAVAPDLVADFAPHAGEPLLTLAARWREAARPAPLPEPTFTQAVFERGEVDGNFVLLGAAAGPEARSYAVFQSNDRLVAIAPGGARGAAWATALDSPFSANERAARGQLSQGLVHVASLDRLEAFGLADGDRRWLWSAPLEHVVLSVTATDGVLLARLRPALDASVESLVAVEESTGVELWRRPVVPQSAPIAAEGRLVVIEPRGGRAHVVDLFLGGIERTLDIGAPHQAGVGTAWIHRGRLVVPQYYRDGEPDRNHVEAWDLDSGRRDWRIDLSTFRGATHVLHAVLEYAPPGGEPRRLLLLSDAPEPGRASRLTAHVLNERLGALDRSALVELRNPAHQLVGITTLGHQQLDGPVFLVARPSRDGTSTSVEAIDVYRGPLWSQPLPRGARAGGLNTGPAPAFGRDAVALLYAVTVPEARRTRLDWELTFLDRSSGKMLESRVVQPGTDRRERWHELTAVGRGLILSGPDRIEHME